MNELLRKFYELSGLSPFMEGKVGTTVAAVIALWLLRIAGNMLITREISNSRYEYQIRKAVSYGVLFMGLFIVGRIWFEGFQSLTTILGFASAGIAIALREPIANVAGWFYLLWDNTFDVGDRIEIDGVKGDVVDQDICHFSVMEVGNWMEGDQSTGRIIHIPNSAVFTKPLVNYSSDFPFVWDELRIRLTFESNRVKATEIVTHAVEAHAKKNLEEAEKALRKARHTFMIQKSTRSLRPQVFLGVKEWGVQITATYVTDCFKRRDAQAALWQTILDAFEKEPDIRFAYPAMQVHNDAQSQAPFGDAEKSSVR